MPKKVGKAKKLSKAISRERKALEAENSDVPKTMIFCKPNSSNLVKQLVDDFQSTMKPHTLKEIYCSRKNNLKDYIEYAAKNHVKNIIYFTHAKSSKKVCDWNESTNYKRGGVYCHNVIIPHGPSFTYRVKEYTLKRDIQTLSGFGMNSNWLQKHPLLICEGFGNSENSEYLKAVSSSFQNMLPTLNINKMEFNSVRRALLLSHQNVMPNTDELTQKKLGEVFVFRHYFIKLENKELNKNIRKLGVGVTSKNVKVPDLSKYTSIAEFIDRTGNVSESEMSDFEGDGATIELTKSVKELPGSTGKTAVRLMEIGPRMTLQLIKIHEGIHSGALLYHRIVKRTKEEELELEKRRTEKLKLKEKRREQQMKNVENKRKLKEEQKKLRLEGKTSKPETVSEEDNVNDEQNENQENISSEDEEMEEEIIEEDIEESEDEHIEDEDSEDDDDGIEDVDDSLDDETEFKNEETISDDGIEDVNDSLDEVLESDDDSDNESENINSEDSDDIEGNDDLDNLEFLNCNSDQSDFEIDDKNVKGESSLIRNPRKRTLVPTKKSGKKKKYDK